MDRRIGVTPAQLKLLEELTSPVPGQNFALFDTKQKALMFAASLGMHLKRRIPLASRDQGTAIRFDIFEKALDDGYAYCIAVADTAGLNILGTAHEEEFGRLLEEYANAGLAELQARVIGGGDWLQALIALMNEARYPRSDEGLEGMDPGILSNLLGR